MQGKLRYLSSAQYTSCSAAVIALRETTMSHYFATTECDPLSICTYWNADSGVRVARYYGGNRPLARSHHTHDSYQIAVR